jgi:hypothetical protein
MASPTPFSLSIPSIDEILTSPLPPVNWVLPRFLAQGDVAILGGPPYCGKSWIMAELAVSFASGRSAFNYAPSLPPQRVLWIDEENSKEESWTRIREVVKAHNLSADDLRDTFLQPTPRQQFNFRSAKHLLALDKLVESYQPQWVFMDSLTAVAAFREESASRETRSFYTSFLMPLASSGAGVFIIHHNRKPGIEEGVTTFNPGDFNNLRGSGDIPAVCESILMAWRIDNRVHVHSAKARRDPEHGEIPPKDLILTLNKENSGRRPILSSLSLPFGQKTKAIQNTILTLLGSSPLPLSHPELLEGVRVALDSPDINAKSVQNRVHELIKSGEIRTVEDPEDGRRVLLTL